MAVSFLPSTLISSDTVVRCRCPEVKLELSIYISLYSHKSHLSVDFQEMSLGLVVYVEDIIAMYLPCQALILLSDSITLSYKKFITSV